MNKYDIIGIGFGPANIALAVAMEELYPEMSAVYFERKAKCMWHPNMLFDGADIQNHPLRDFVTPRNPRSYYSFTNYLYEHERLFEYLNLGVIFPPRNDYAKYIEWVAGHFTNKVKYNSEIVNIEYQENSAGYNYLITDNSGNEYFSKGVVLAPGRTPYIPDEFLHLDNDRTFHLTDYLQNIDNINSHKKIKNVAVVGSSQSAVEIILNLNKTYPDINIYGVTRSFGYRQKDTSPFTGEVYFPEFVDYYYNVNKSDKKSLNNDLRYTNYSAVDSDILNELYLCIYTNKIDNRNNILLKNNSVVSNAVDTDNGVLLTVKDRYKNTSETTLVDAVILATGFRDIGTEERHEKIPKILSTIASFIEFDSDSTVNVDINYRVRMKSKVKNENPLFLNGLCESSHGMGDAGSFSLLSLRSEAIVSGLYNSIYGEEQVSDIAEVLNVAVK